MKVVDMFSGSMPVCAMDYACIGELVDDGFTGFLFTDADTLHDCMLELLNHFPRNAEL